MLPPLMTFWFFMTPILYSPALLPEKLAVLMNWNPMSWFVERLRAALMYGDYSPSWGDIVIPLAVLLLCFLGLRFFRRMSGHFEDFL